MSVSAYPDDTANGARTKLRGNSEHAALSIRKRTEALVAGRVTPAIFADVGVANAGCPAPRKSASSKPIVTLALEDAVCAR